MPVLTISRYIPRHDVDHETFNTKHLQSSSSPRTIDSDQSKAKPMDLVWIGGCRSYPLEMHAIGPRAVRIGFVLCGHPVSLQLPVSATPDKMHHQNLPSQHFNQWWIHRHHRHLESWTRPRPWNVVVYNNGGANTGTFGGAVAWTKREESSGHIQCWICKTVRQRSIQIQWICNLMDKAIRAVTLPVIDTWVCGVQTWVCM